MRKCGNCAHYIFDSQQSGPGVCRRYPPIIIQQGVTPKGEAQFVSMFPRVDSEMLCGEYKVVLQ